MYTHGQASVTESRGRLPPDLGEVPVSKQVLRASGATADTIAIVQRSMARYRVAVTEFNDDLRIIRRQSEAALARSHLLLARIERRPQTAPGQLEIGNAQADGIRTVEDGHRRDAPQ